MWIASELTMIHPKSSTYHMEQAFRICAGVVPHFRTAMSQAPSANGSLRSVHRRWIRAELLQFFAREDHRVSQRFLVQEWKWKRHVLLELLEVRDIGAALGQDLAYFFWRFEKLVIPE